MRVAAIMSARSMSFHHEPAASPRQNERHMLVSSCMTTCCSWDFEFCIGAVTGLDESRGHSLISASVLGADLGAHRH